MEHTNIKQYLELLSICIISCIVYLIKFLHSLVTSLQSKINFDKILATILWSFMILLGFLLVTGDNYNLVRDILATAYAYSADWPSHLYKQSPIFLKIC